MKKKNYYWNKLEALHAFLLNSGAVVDVIRLHPSSFKALQREFGRPLIGAVTISGHILIKEDNDGVKFDQLK